MTGRRTLLLAALMLASCAAPPVTLYTLNGAGQTGLIAPLAAPALVIAVSRLTVPDYLDTQDILVRRGSVLASSHVGRWASRLSVGATEQVTARLASQRPDALVTDQPQTTAPAYRIVINVSRLDLAAPAAMSEGTVALDADWQIIPANAEAATGRYRAQLVVTGPLRDDRDAVALTTAVLDRLAAAIDVTRLR